MHGGDRQIAARRIIERLKTFKRHLIDLIVASEPADTEIYAKALLIREATDALIAEYRALLDYPPPAALPTIAPYLREGEQPSAIADEGDDK